MRKIILVIVVLLSFALLTSCIEAPTVVDVQSLELVGFQPSEYYEKDGDYSSIKDALVRITFTPESGKDDLVLSLSNQELVIGGSGWSSTTGINTTTVGDKEIVIAYGGTTVEVNFKVVQYLVEPGVVGVIKAAVAAVYADAEAPALPELYINAGEYIDADIQLTEPIKLIGPVYGTAFVTAENGTSGRIMHVKSGDVTIANLTLQLGFNISLYTGLIQIDALANGGHVYINNNVIRGLLPGNILLDNLQSAGISTANAFTSILHITNNTIYNVRNGINRVSVEVAGNPIPHVITNNVIFHTKGGIMLANGENTTNVEKLAVTISGNSWTSTNPTKYNSHNEWDILYFNNLGEEMSNGAEPTGQVLVDHPDYDGNLLLYLSAQNNEAYVMDRYVFNEATTGQIISRAVNNRSHLFVVDPDNAEGLNAFKEQVNPGVWFVPSRTFTTPYSALTIFDGVIGATNYVTPEGSLLSLAEKSTAVNATYYPGYASNAVIPWWRDVTNEIGNYGGNFDVYWRPAESVADALEQGPAEWVKIMVWTEVSGVWQFVEYER